MYYRELETIPGAKEKHDTLQKSMAKARVDKANKQANEKRKVRKDLSK